MLQPTDFAYGIELSPGEGSIRRFRLPYEVFKGMARSDYGDLRVFNTQGQAVPFLIEAEPTDEQQAYRVALKFYPLPDKGPTAVDQQLDVKVERRAFSEILTLNASSANTPSTAITTSYIIDNSNKDDPLERLHLDWHQQGESLIGQLQIEKSTDMEKWSVLVSNVVIARLKYNDARFSKSHIELPPTKARFLRINWLENNPGATLNRIVGEYSRQTDVGRLQWVYLDQPRFDDEHNSYLFDTAGIAPLIKIVFEFPNDGFFYKGRLYSRDRKDNKWRHRSRFIQYRLNIEATELVSEPIILPPTRDRYWKVVLEQPANSPPEQLQPIRIAWQPMQISFLAQGQGPFLLAYGNPTVEPADYAMSSLMQSINSSLTVADYVEPGDSLVLGGAKRLQPPAKPVPWKKVILWMVLLIGVAIMALMARSLYAQMSQSSGSQ
jgi:hypothetical protein